MGIIETQEMSDMEYSAYGQLGIIALKSAAELGGRVDKLILERREKELDFKHDGKPLPDTYIVPIEEVRFSNGEGKVKLNETVRGKDIYLLCDIGNYNCTYKMYGHENRMGPDEHFQDLKRAVSAIGGKARRTTVIMPYLYASRQDKRKGRESLDCAMALQELENMGVKDILSFDMHATSVQNAVPLVSFENLYTTYDILNALFSDEKEMFSQNGLIVLSPDTGGMDRAVFYANILNVDVGLFYKRRDYKRVIGGKNPIVAHEYMGRDVEGQNILIVDDIIASGDSVLEIVEDLKKRKAKHIFVATTFALFTEGVDKFNAMYEAGKLDRVYATNLTYICPEARNSKWFRTVDMSFFLAKMIDFLNYTRSLEPLVDATQSLRTFLDSHF